MSEPHVIARFAKNNREEVVISFDTFRGVELLDLRIYANFEDPSAAAKVVKAFRKDNQKLQIKAGLIEGQLLSPEAVEEQLATMPGKDELRATLLATMQAPLQQFVQQLNAPLQNFAYLLKAKEDREGGGGAG